MPFRRRHRREEKWLKAHYNDVAAKYRGEWIAVERDRIVSHNPSLKKAAEAAHRDAFLAYIPEMIVPKA